MTDPNSGQPNDPYGQSQNPQQPAYGESQVPPAPQYGEQAPQYGQPSPYGEQSGQQAPQYGEQPKYGQPQAPYGEQQNPYGQPAAPYGQPQAPYGYAQPTGPKTNVMAIISLIAPFVGFGVVGLVLGIIALGQIKRTGEQGRGLALAGTIVSGVSVLVGVIFIIFYVLLIAGAIGTASSYNYDY